jgi:hypothetical protein
MTVRLLAAATVRALATVRRGDDVVRPVFELLPNGDTNTVFDGLKSMSKATVLDIESPAASVV